MTVVSEKSFGARLLHAQNILTYIQNFNGYSPPQQEQTAANFGNFLDDIAEANMIESELEQGYKAAVKNRQDAFWNNTVSVMKLLAPIRGAVEAQYGKESQECQTVSSLIAQMRAVKLIPSTPDTNSPPSAQNVSQSQQSYGSIVGYFHDLIAMLSQMNSYNPSNTALQVTNLQIFAQSLNTLNSTVADQYQQLHQQRSERLALYDSLSNRVQKIKAYVKAQYGVDSEPYTIMKGIQV